MEHFRVTPADTMIFEDSGIGLTAAKASGGKGGSRVVAVLRQYRIILSADTASEVRQMLSQKRR